MWPLLFVIALVACRDPSDPPLVPVPEGPPSPRVNDEPPTAELHAPIPGVRTGPLVTHARPAELDDASLSAPQLTALGARYAEAGNLPAAANLLQEAARRDPRHADAWAALARTLALMRHGGEPCAHDATLARLFDALDRAVALDPGLREAMASEAAFDGVRDKVRFKVAAGIDVGTPSGLVAALTGTTFVEPPQGVVGSGLELRFFDDGTFSLAGAQGTWSLRETAVLMTIDGRTHQLRLTDRGDLVSRGPRTGRWEERIVWTDVPVECDG